MIIVPFFVVWCTFAFMAGQSYERYKNTVVIELVEPEE